MFLFIICICVIFFTIWLMHDSDSIQIDNDTIEKKKKSDELLSKVTDDFIRNKFNILDSNVKEEIATKDNEYVLKNYKNDKYIEYDKETEDYLVEEERKFLLRQNKDEFKNVKFYYDSNFYWKKDWKEFKRILDANGINKLYHFTERENLVSIKENGGLYSWYYCQNNKTGNPIHIPMPGGDDLSRTLDLKYDLQNFVRLSFTKKHPMMYSLLKSHRLKDPIVLEIDIEMIYKMETRFSNMNATKNGHVSGNSISDFKNIKFEIVKQHNHFNLTEEQKKYYQAEVMVLRTVPLIAITNFNEFGVKSDKNFAMDHEDYVPY